MYGWMFRHLPGPLWMRIMLSVLLLAAILALLVQFVFPWLEQFTSLTDSTIGAAQIP